MSDYPMLISNKLHYFRNFKSLKYEKSGTLRPAFQINTDYFFSSRAKRNTSSFVRT